MPTVDEMTLDETPTLIRGTIYVRYLLEQNRVLRIAYISLQTISPLG